MLVLVLLVLHAADVRLLLACWHVQRCCCCWAG
jgi:hypothetical protein